MTERILLDTCVLYPTLMRRLLLATARAGYFVPFWSPRILDEWRHAAARSGDDEAQLVSAEIALIEAQFPTARITPDPKLIETLYLPDPDDRHVLAAAIEGAATALLTLNLRDFPTRTLSAKGVLRYEPDWFFCQMLETEPGCAELIMPVLEDASDHLDRPIRQLLKKSRLPRLGKALAAS